MKETTAATNMFVIKTDVYEGPLEVLLDLIERRKLLINDITLAEVADEFVAYTRNMPDFQVHQVAQFVLVASTLLLIKSKSLLPVLELTPEEEEDVRNLEERLKLYKEIRILSRHVKSRFGVFVALPRQSTTSIDPVFTPGQEITQNSLLEAAERLITSFPTPEKLHEVVVDKVMSLEDMITTLTGRVQDALSMSFKEFSKTSHKDATIKEIKLNVVVSFLALLELVKDGIVAARQQVAFEDIQMEPQGTAGNRRNKISIK